MSSLEATSVNSLAMTVTGAVRTVEPAAALVGHVALPGDRAISQRAAFTAALGEGESAIAGFAHSLDTDTSLAALRALGVAVEADDEVVTVRGTGLRELREPAEPIDCGASATTLALLAGVVAGGSGRFGLTGDESLWRTMERLTVPLREMGASVEPGGGGTLVTIEGRDLRGVRHEPSTATARVKSCLLYAGLFAREGRTTIVEPVPTRDHTEIMLRVAGASVRRSGREVVVSPASELASLGEIAIPGDFSAAAPFVVAATLLPGSELFLHEVGVNPTRIGLLDVLERMGARITLFNRRRFGAEPVADIEVRSAPLTATAIEAHEVPRLLGELPLFVVAAACARGESLVHGASELGEVGPDRIEAVTTELKRLGARVTGRHDGFRVRGVPTRPRGGAMDSRGDPGLAILGGVAGLISREGVRLDRGDAVERSFPRFFELLETVAER